MHRRVGVMVLLGLCVGCGSKSPTQPTTPPSTVPTPARDPVVRLQVQVDEGTLRDAVASMSDVVVDASGSTGSGALTFSIDFGDGTVASSATARHTYAAAGTFAIVATVTDGQAKTARGSSSVVVKTVAGRWFQAEYVRRSKRVEIRQMTIDGQDGLSVRGVYRTTGDADRTFTGTLTPPRQVRIAISGGAALEGLLPDRLNDAAVPWPLNARGDSVDGERLEFRAIVGEPGAAPVADMRVQFGNGTAAAPIPSLTPVQIDGAASRGTDLSYFIEFGDGAVAAASQGSHVIEVDPNDFLTARLTVVDRFGRTDSRSRLYYLFRMPQGGGGDSWFTFGLPGGDLWMTFPERSGTTYGATIYRTASSSHADYRGSGTAVLSGDGDIRVTIPALGVEYRGKLTISEMWDGTRLTLVQSGGPDDGRTWVLRIRSYS